MGDVTWLHSEYHYAFLACEWAETHPDGPHLDPMGASDLLGDLHTYAVSRHRIGNIPDTYQELWENFKTTEIWYQYFPSDRSEIRWKVIDFPEFDRGGWKAGRVTLIRGNPDRYIYEVAE